MVNLTNVSVRRTVCPSSMKANVILIYNEMKRENVMRRKK